MTSPHRIDATTSPHATKPDARATYQVRRAESTGSAPAAAGVGCVRRPARSVSPNGWLPLRTPLRCVAPKPSSKSGAGRVEPVGSWSRPGAPEFDDELPFEECARRRGRRRPVRAIAVVRATTAPIDTAAAIDAAAAGAAARRPRPSGTTVDRHWKLVDSRWFLLGFLPGRRDHDDLERPSGCIRSPCVGLSATVRSATDGSPGLPSPPMASGATASLSAHLGDRRRAGLGRSVDPQTPPSSLPSPTRYYSQVPGRRPPRPAAPATSPPPSSPTSSSRDGADPESAERTGVVATREADGGPGPGFGRRRRHRRHAVPGRLRTHGCSTVGGALVDLVVHPQVGWTRDPTGRLTSVPGSASHAALTESFVHIEIERQIGADATDALATTICSASSATSAPLSRTGPTMHERALDLVKTLGRPSLRRAKGEVSEGRAFLKWFAADHFTFLGYREYDLVDRERRSMRFTSCEGRGLGILRGPARGQRATPRRS